MITNTEYPYFRITSCFPIFSTCLLFRCFSSLSLYSRIMSLHMAWRCCFSKSHCSDSALCHVRCIIIDSHTQTHITCNSIIVSLPPTLLSTPLDEWQMAQTVQKDEFQTPSLRQSQALVHLAMAHRPNRLPYPQASTRLYARL